VGIAEEFRSAGICFTDHAIGIGDNDRVWRDLEEVLQRDASEFGGCGQISSRQNGVGEVDSHPFERILRGKKGRGYASIGLRSNFASEI